jgi:hypothetical protein
MSDNIVDIGVTPQLNSPVDFFKYFAKKDICSRIKHAIVISQDEDGGLDVSYTEMDPADICFLMTFLNAFVQRSLIESPEED